MINSFNSISDAKNSWKNDECWSFERRYFRGIPDGASICKEIKQGKLRYFIITHPMCVKYRRDIGEHVCLLTKARKKTKDSINAGRALVSAIPLIKSKLI